MPDAHRRLAAGIIITAMICATIGWRVSTFDPHLPFDLRAGSSIAGPAVVGTVLLALFNHHPVTAHGIAILSIAATLCGLVAEIGHTPSGFIGGVDGFAALGAILLLLWFDDEEVR